MDLLIVESRADWSHWNRLTRTLNHPVHVLVQAAGESTEAFYERVESKIGSATPLPQRIVILCDGAPREIRLNELRGSREHSARAGLQPSLRAHN